MKGVVMYKKIFFIAILVLIGIGIRYAGIDSPRIIYVDKLPIIKPTLFYMSKENKVFFDNDEYLCGIDIGCTKQLHFDDNIGRYVVFKNVLNEYIFIGINKANNVPLNVREKVFGQYNFDVSKCKVKKDFNDLKKIYKYNVLFDMYDISLDSNNKVIIDDVLKHICHQN
jgi:hypothetical protein